MTRLTRKPVFVAALALLLFVALGALSAVDAASSVTDDDAAADATEMPNFAKMRVKQLRKVLKDRGQDCVGCVEKQDFVERAREVWHMPVTSGGGDEAPKKTEESSPPPDLDTEAILEQFREQQRKNEELKDQLRKQGINVDGMNFGGGFGGMDPSMFADALKGAKKAQPTRKAKKPVVSDEDVEEVIEL